MWLARTLVVSLALALLALPALAQASDAPDTSALAGGKGVLAEVTGDDVNVRSGPSVDYHDIGRLSRGALVVRVGEDVDGDWSRVHLPGGPVVYVFAPLVQWDDGALRGTVRADDVLMRATPAQAHLPVRDQKLQRGDEVIVLGVEDGDEGRWLRVIAPDRVHVWVHSRYVRVLEGRVDADRVRALAEARLDALTDGRTREERDARRQEERARWTRQIEALESAVAAGRAGDGERRTANDIAARAPYRDLRERAAAAAAAIERVVAKRDQAARAAETARVRREVEDMAREEREREERYRRQMEALENVRRRTGRGEPLDTGTVAQRGGRIVLLHGETVVRDLRSRRFRLRDFVGRRVRVWGDRSARGSGGGEPLDVSSIEIVSVTD